MNRRKRGRQADEFYYEWLFSPAGVPRSSGDSFRTRSVPCQVPLPGIVTRYRIPPVRDPPGSGSWPLKMRVHAPRAGADLAVDRSAVLESFVPVVWVKRTWKREELRACRHPNRAPHTYAPKGYVDAGSPNRRLGTWIPHAKPLGAADVAAEGSRGMDGERPTCNAFCHRPVAEHGRSLSLKEDCFEVAHADGVHVSYRCSYNRGVCFKLFCAGTRFLARVRARHLHRDVHRRKRGSARRRLRPCEPLHHAENYRRSRLPARVRARMAYAEHATVDAC